MTARKPETDAQQSARRTFIKRTLLAATVLSLPPLLAACGGGSDGDEATTPGGGSSSSSSSASSSAKSTAKFAVLSDIHLYDIDALGSNADLAAYLTLDRKMIKESVPIFAAAMDDIATQDVDFLLITGDLTKDDERVNHELLAAYLKDFGKPVYVIPGNHDVNNPDAKGFGSTTTAVAQVSPAEFRSLYADCGYGTAIHTDPDSLSYIVEPTEGLWLFAIDSCKYADNLSLGHPVTSGAIGSATLAWLTGKLAEARAQGKQVMGMMHHGLIEHFAGQSLLFPEYLVDDRAAVAAALAAAGLGVMFTGHFHANDLVRATYDGKTIHDVETGSTVTAPCPYRLCSLDTVAGTLSIATSVVDDITVTNSASDYVNGADFQAYAQEYLSTGLKTLVSGMLQAAPYSLPSAAVAQVLPLIVPAMVAHYAGDEALTDATTLATLQAMAGSTDANTALIGQMVLSLWNDAAPADNTLSLTL
ncbi:MAG: metallophosphoesterase [Candidatus Dactylopiibacterium carminicum]|uniref:Metallophosphoesterase n=1 Tax=Candidatus Dactylopiibacterium carminicum TaxID=857335 RepID=A0A272EPQ4_9RHOO|nr:metallophosphoesterase [Candidatus Dactylopiibacterium carminicum]KAF7598500.1 metallophosphoesterase [Candidatus Dactylopiibacterium carminicum]PAS92095.1 MAG: metallophosphoesterase [Candidatus Dactylopiibacterium carminicum]PAS95517.1 MAG: metallophosphoesterase [Candidatus Dactylopiibacterium carminicum]PAS97899.1 MAG: metallophosphoesterase [Candidatus Dactylopiibacterium carminicum]